MDLQVLYNNPTPKEKKMAKKRKVFKKKRNPKLVYTLKAREGAAAADRSVDRQAKIDKEKERLVRIGYSPAEAAAAAKKKAIKGEIKGLKSRVKRPLVVGKVDVPSQAQVDKNLKPIAEAISKLSKMPATKGNNKLISKYKGILKKYNTRLESIKKRAEKEQAAMDKKGYRVDRTLSPKDVKAREAKLKRDEAKLKKDAERTIAKMKAEAKKQEKQLKSFSKKADKMAKKTLGKKKRKKVAKKVSKKSGKKVARKSKATSKRKGLRKKKNPIIATLSNPIIAVNPKKAKRKGKKAKKKTAKKAAKKVAKKKPAKKATKKKTSKKKSSKKMTKAQRKAARKAAARAKKAAMISGEQAQTTKSKGKRKSKSKRKGKKASYKAKAMTKTPKRKGKHKSKKNPYSLKSNPFGGAMKKVSEFTQEHLAHDLAEAGGLIAGGAAIKGIQHLRLKFLPQLSSTVASIPVVGAFLEKNLDTLIPLAVGIVANKFVKEEKVQALSKGIIGASVVNIGASLYVQAARMAGSPMAGIIAVPSGMSGIIAVPEMGAMKMVGDFQGMGNMSISSADFGAPSGVGLNGGYLQDADFDSAGPSMVAPRQPNELAGQDYFEVDYDEEQADF